MGTPLPLYMLKIQLLMEFGSKASDDLSSHGQLYITLGLVSDFLDRKGVGVWSVMTTSNFFFGHNYGSLLYGCHLA